MPQVLEAIQDQENRLRCNTHHAYVSWRCCDLPQVLKAIQDQENRLQHTTTIYLHNEVAQYAKELTDRMPGNLKASVVSLSEEISVGCARQRAAQYAREVADRMPGNLKVDGRPGL